LLFSAAAFERQKDISLQTLTDLTTLIDLYCLYDRIIVLGRGSYGTVDSEFLNSLDKNVVTPKDVPPQMAPRVAQAAATHLAISLERPETPRLRAVINSLLDPSDAEYGLLTTPDTRPTLR
jgi:hypothetical protein